MCQDILLNHVPASAHGAAVATQGPEMVTTLLFHVEEFLPEHTADSTFDHL